jgi:hypothetical protein
MNKILVGFIIVLTFSFIACPGTGSEDQIKEYTVTIGGLTNGTITANPTSGIEGTEIVLTVTPSNGYCLKNGTLKYGTNLIDEATKKFNLPAENTIVMAEFIAVNITPPTQTVYVVGSKKNSSADNNNPILIDDLDKDQKFAIAGFDVSLDDNNDITNQCALQWPDGTTLVNDAVISSERRGTQTINVLSNNTQIGTFDIKIITPEDYVGTWNYNTSSIIITLTTTESNGVGPIPIYEWYPRDDGLDSSTYYPMGFAYYFDLLDDNGNVLYGAWNHFTLSLDGLYMSNGSSVWTKQ